MILIIKCLKLSLFIINLVIVNMMLRVGMMIDYHNDNKGVRALKSLIVRPRLMGLDNNQSLSSLLFRSPRCLYHGSFSQLALKR